MIALATVVVVALVSMLIARVAPVAIALTGLSREAARFQARSALSGAGFTTSEAEAVVKHPVRRPVVTALLLVGIAGLVTCLATLSITFANTDRAQAFGRLGVLIVALAALYALSRNAWVDRRLGCAIRGRARPLHAARRARLRAAAARRRRLGGDGAAGAAGRLARRPHAARV